MFLVNHTITVVNDQHTVTTTLYPDPFYFLNSVFNQGDGQHCYNTGFALDDLAQRQANVNGMRVFKLGYG